MQFKPGNSRNHFNLMFYRIGRPVTMGTLLVLILSGGIPPARAQFGFGHEMSSRTRISGSVMLDGNTQPAARVRVDVKGTAGGDVMTTFTDASGRFEAPAAAEGSVIVAVQEEGYEPVEQRVDVGRQGMSQGIFIVLHRLRAQPVEPGGSTGNGYTVSVHDLKVPGKARHEFQKGLELLQKKDVAGSLNHFKEATDAYPDYYEAYYQIGLANLELRRGNEAEQALQRAIDLSGGGYADPQFALGALLCDRQEYSEAERVLRRAIEVDANSWKGHLFLGQALFGQDKLEEAEKSAREVLLRRSDVPSVHLLLANIHIRRQEYILGIKDLDTFLSMKPEGPSSDQARAVRAAAERIASRLEQTVSTPIFPY
jgi:Carboxypeptidase regulatory-like domain/Tetratricopeptide repeat